MAQTCSSRTLQQGGWLIAFLMDIEAQEGDDHSVAPLSYCRLDTEGKESRTGCPAFLFKFIVIEVNHYHESNKGDFGY